MHRRMSRHRRARYALFVALAAAAVALGLWLMLAPENEPTTVSAAAPSHPTTSAKADKPLSDDDRKVPDEERAAAIARAQVWREPSVPISQASFAGANLEEVSCRFKVSDVGGTTPKFDCDLQSGEEIRIKYGNGPEVPAETAATRLLAALGFGADSVTLVRRLRCYGCPEEPFSVLKAVELTHAASVYEKLVDRAEYEDFEWVALERKLNARPLETEQVEGWSFVELDAIDEGAGGAPRAHVDALRIVAMLLAHWDNKPENQRIVCLSQEWPEGTPCREPFLMLQDVGATFGPVKMDFEGWRDLSIWDDRAACTISMRNLPFQGATFGQATITEAGRRFAVRLLSQLSEAQLTDLFRYARFGETRGLFTPVAQVSDWVDAFRAKIVALSEGPPCPEA
jgi:hypothetical protein